MKDHETTKIVKLQISNFMRIFVAEISPDGDVIELTGSNGSGKTSAMTALWSLLRGIAVPDRPIKDGEDKAVLKLELDNGMTAMRTFTRNGSRIGSIKITTDSATLNSPQKILDDLIGNRCLDPHKFVQGSPKEQFDELREVVGLDFSKLDSERETAYNERTLVNRDLKAVTARFDALPMIPADCPTEEQPTANLFNRLTKASDVNRENDRQRAKLEEYNSEAARSLQRQNRISEKITELQEALADEMSELKSEEDNAQDIQDAKATHIKSMEGIEDIDAEAIKAELAIIEENNRKARKAIGIRADKKNLAAEVKAKKTESENLTRAIEDIDSQKHRMLEAAEFPIENLSIGDGEVLYNGVPLSQASDGEKWLVASSIAMAGNPKLKVIFVRAGALLDSKTRKKLFAAAKAKGFQVWIETMDESGEVGIVFEDGRISE